MSDENMEKIPHDQTDNFPTGVSEQSFDTVAEMNAFLLGFQFADDVDAYNSEPFERNGKQVIRVCVGDWAEEDGSHSDNDE